MSRLKLISLFFFVFFFLPSHLILDLSKGVLLSVQQAIKMSMREKDREKISSSIELLQGLKLSPTDSPT